MNNENQGQPLITPEANIGGDCEHGYPAGHNCPECSSSSPEPGEQATREGQMGLKDALREALPLLEIVRDYEPGQPDGACPANRARVLCEHIQAILLGQEGEQGTLDGKEAVSETIRILQNALNGIRSRLSQPIAWFKQENPVAPKFPDWWLTDFTKSQLDGNIAACIKLVDDTLKVILSENPNAQSASPVTPKPDISAAAGQEEGEQVSRTFSPLRTDWRWPDA